MYSRSCAARTLPPFTFSCINRSATSMCLTLPNPRRLASDRPVIASVKMRISDIDLRSLSIAGQPDAADPAFTMA